MPPTRESPSTQRPAALRAGEHNEERNVEQVAPRKLGRYEILFEIARGGMGQVHLARAMGEHGFARLVAIKTLSPDRFRKEDFSAFVAEARITSVADHPNVVRCIDFGTEGATPFLVMQFVEGPSLSRLLDKLSERDEVLPVEIAIWIGIQVAEGLRAAHELTGPTGVALGVVHRDVSPQNVLLSFAGRVLVADFGIAKLVDTERLTHSAELKGKFVYMSPEQTRGELVDRRSDIFSFGSVMYEMLTGKRAFPAASPAEAIYQINNARVRPVSEFRPQVPPALDVLVAKCLDRDRERRPDSMGECASMLRAILRNDLRAVDESDVAALLAREFRGEQDVMRERIRAASTGAPAEAESGPSQPLSPAFPSATLTASALPGVAEQRRSVLLVGSVIALLLVLGYLGLRRSASPPQPAATQTAGVDPPTVVPQVTVSAAADAQGPVPPVGSPLSTHSAPVSSTGSPVRSKAPPVAPVPSVTATTSASASHKGTPFRGL